MQLCIIKLYSSAGICILINEKLQGVPGDERCFYLSPCVDKMNHPGCFAFRESCGCITRQREWYTQNMKEVLYCIGARLVYIDQPTSTLCKANSRLAPSQWETSFQSNVVSHWLGAKPESALLYSCVRLPGMNQYLIMAFYSMES